MRILLANSNTSEQVTATVLAAAQAIASPGTELIARNGAFGARVVSTHTEAAIAGHALVDLLAEHAGECDAVVIAMSMDTGLWAAREMLDVPVLGMTEASMLLACTAAPRFGMLIMAGRGLELYRGLARDYGLEHRMAGIAGINAQPQDLLNDPEAFYRPLIAEAERLIQQGAEAIVLVGAVMAGLPAKLQDRIPVPLLDGIASGVLLAETLVKLKPVKPRIGSLQPVPKRETIGLRQPLSEYFSRER